MSPIERKELHDDIKALMGDLVELQAVEIEYSDRALDLIRFDILGDIAELREHIAAFHEKVRDLNVPEMVDPDTPPIFGVGFKGGKYAA